MKSPFLTKTFGYLFDNRVTNFFKKHFFDKIREINIKYAKPRIPMTRMVALCTFFLQVYLLFLVGVLFFKFYTLVKGS